MTEHSGDEVDFESKAYRDDQLDRDAIAALRSSTRGMRLQGDEYLKREEQETDPRYQARLARSFLFAALDDTIDKLVAKPFAQEVNIRGDLPAKLQPMLENADLAGSSLTVFARHLFDTAVANGLAHVFVDFQVLEKVKEDLGRKVMASDEQKGLVRPYFVFIHPSDLLGWDEWTAPNGEQLVVGLRWKEIRQEADGKYGTKEVDYMRVVRNPPDALGSFELHRKDEKTKKWSQESTGAFTWAELGLPIFTHYTGKKAFMRADPPLRDLMWKNIEHWQKASDYNQALRFAALIMLAGSGMPAEVVKNKLPLGHGAAHYFANTDAKLEWVEAKGTSIKVLEEALDKLHEEMESLGLAPLMRKTANTTATSQRSTDDKNEAPIQTWVRDLDHTLLGALKAAGIWVNEDIGDTAPEVFNEFKLTGSRTEIVKTLLEIRKKGDISHELFLREVQKHAFISDDVDILEEIAKTMEEKERMAELFAPDPEEEEEPDEETEDDDNAAA